MRREPAEMLDPLIELVAHELLVVSGKCDAGLQRVSLAGQQHDHRHIRRVASASELSESASLGAIHFAPLGDSSRRRSAQHFHRHCADGIAAIPQLCIDPAKVRTNIVICDCANTGKTAVEFCEELYKHGIWAQDTALHSVRFVTHCDVDRAGTERALPLIRQVASNTKKAKA